MLTLWSETQALNDYAGKEWSGMLGGYYASRWKQFLDAAAESLCRQEFFDEKTFNQELLK